MKIKLLLFTISLVVMSAFAFSPHQAVLTGHGANVAYAITDCGTPELVYDVNTGLCVKQTAGGTTSVNELIIKIINLLLGVTAAVAILFIVIGGFQYITSAGNEEQATKGKKTVVNALIGLVIIILAYVIVNVVANAAAGIKGGVFGS